MRAKVDGGGDDAAGSESASSPIQNPASDLWIPYYEAAHREADERAAIRARHAQAAHVLTRVVWVAAVIGGAALFALLR